MFTPPPALANLTTFAHIAFDSCFPIAYPFPREPIIPGFGNRVGLASFAQRRRREMERGKSMYSVLLAAMLTTGGEATTWHNGRSFGWCHGCYGGCSGCYGCWGGGYSCHGCRGGSYYSGCYGCWGGYSSGCHGCWGGSYYSGCHGCWGCYGGCNGRVIVQPAVVYSGCSGCYGGVIYTDPVTLPSPSKEKRKEFKPPPPTEKDEVSQTNVARITVNLPAEAKLWIDDVLCPLTSGTRSFKTPTLEAGRQYFYTLTVELNQDGQNIAENRRIYVTPGQQVNVDFTNMATASR
jgi:uncharacterized protein (TIGR03000 family)